MPEPLEREGMSAEEAVAQFRSLITRYSALVTPLGGRRSALMALSRDPRLPALTLQELNRSVDAVALQLSTIARQVQRAADDVDEEIATARTGAATHDAEQVLGELRENVVPMLPVVREAITQVGYCVVELDKLEQRYAEYLA